MLSSDDLAQSLITRTLLAWEILINFCCGYGGVAKCGGLISKKGVLGSEESWSYATEKNEEELTCQVSLMVTAEYSVDSYSSDDIEKTLNHVMWVWVVAFENITPYFSLPATYLTNFAVVPWSNWGRNLGKPFVWPQTPKHVQWVSKGWPKWWPLEWMLLYPWMFVWKKKRWKIFISNGT